MLRKILSTLSSISFCFLGAACSPQIPRSQYLVYVDSATSGVLVPLRNASGTTSTPVQFGGETQAMAFASTENVLYILNSRIKGDHLIGTAIPYNLTTQTAAKPITVGTGPSYIAITPNGRTAYIANKQSGTVTPIDVPTDTASKPIRVGLAPSYIAIMPTGRIAYVVNTGSNTVTPIDTATNRASKAIEVGDHPIQMAITPNGRIAYVVNEY